MNRILDVFDGRAYWRHLANTAERLCLAVTSGDTAFSQITFGSFVVINGPDLNMVLRGLSPPTKINNLPQFTSMHLKSKRK